MEPDEYKPKASAKVRTRYHIVLVTKYRKHALAGIEADVLDSIRDAERRSRFAIHRINTGDGNHVHMLVSIPPDMTISGTVSRIKQLTTNCGASTPIISNATTGESATSYGPPDTIAKPWEGTAKA